MLKKELLVSLVRGSWRLEEEDVRKRTHRTIRTALTIPLYKILNAGFRTCVREEAEPKNVRHFLVPEVNNKIPFSHLLQVTQTCLVVGTPKVYALPIGEVGSELFSISAAKEADEMRDLMGSIKRPGTIVSRPACRYEIHSHTHAVNLLTVPSESYQILTQILR